MKSLIVGAGQIGSALYEIFSQYHDCYIRDISPGADDPGSVDILHIAYPDSDSFVSDTRSYRSQYHPRLVMVHSTVAIGTTAILGSGYVHSPERGRFPNLAKEMKAFPKFVSGLSQEDRAFGANYIRSCDWPVVEIGDPKFTEACKLISNAHLGFEVAWRQEVDRIAKDLGNQADMTDVYEMWELSYTKGLMELNQHHMIRPRLHPGPIGGHCVIPSIENLFEPNNKFRRLIEESNECAKDKTKAKVA